MAGQKRGGKQMLSYKEMNISEAERISEIDAACYIKNAWSINRKTREYELTEINWTDESLPNGFEWHLDHFKKTIQSGGKSFGCFDDNTLVGYVTIDARVFGQKERYVLLDQLFVSNHYRNNGIGRKLVTLCAEQAGLSGADKIYLCAGSSEDTIAFYKKLGCRAAPEIDKELLEEDPNDIQLELDIVDFIFKR